ncbi:MAG: DUF433 domain-containing protein, partial [Pyrinomonadaceae bacterium]
VKLGPLRKAHEYLAQTFQSEFPFAKHELKTDGMSVILELAEVDKEQDLRKLIIASSAGQIAWEPDVERRFMEFQYEDDLAMRWAVAGKESPVIIDPRISFGAPTVSGVPTWVLSGRAKAGETLDELADDFGLDPTLIEEALRFEGIELNAA